MARPVNMSSKRKSFFMFFAGCLPALRHEDDPQGMHHDLQIEAERNVFDVHQVVLHSFEHFFGVLCITKLDHSPGSEPRFYF